MPKIRVGVVRALTSRPTPMPKAPKAKIPRMAHTGKTQVVYHHTSPESAHKIMTGGYKSYGQGRLSDKVFVTNNKHLAGFGHATIETHVPRKHIIKGTSHGSAGEQWSMVNVNNINKAKRKRIR